LKSDDDALGGRGDGQARGRFARRNVSDSGGLKAGAGGGDQRDGGSDMANLLINGVGTAAALCSMASFAPQALKIQRERDASSVSLPMYVVTVVGFALWIGYGVMLSSWPLVASNAVCLVLAAWILVLKFRFGMGEAGG
jgi:MtN3 and saliva related transmembrane protein